jgi:hypothetical protein
VSDISNNSKWLALTAAVFAFCVAPTFISYKPYVFTWDDSEYLQRSIIVSRAFWSRSLHGLGVGMVSKRPPMMTLMGLPWRHLASWEDAGKCFVTLVASISLFVALSLFLMLRVGVKPLYLGMASACVLASIGPYPAGASAHFDATAFMADSLFAWITLAALLLIPYEESVISPSIKTAVTRGILWAAVLSAGAMTKVSFLYFVVLIVPILFLVRLRRAGFRSALAALIALGCASAPAAFYLAHWGRRSFENGEASSFGGVAANFYGSSLLPFLVIVIRQSPGLLVSFGIMTAALTYLILRSRIVFLTPAFLALLIALAFGILVIASFNRQVRYAFPAIVALPFLVAILASPKGHSLPGRSAVFASALVFCCLVAAGVPTRYRPDRQSLSRSDAVLAQVAACHPRSVVIATDSPTFNKNLMDLAVAVGTSGSSDEVSTLAYQAMSGVPIEDDFHTLGEADQVVFQDRDALSPAFANLRVSDYEQYVRQNGRVPIRVGNDLSVYSMRCRP